MVPSCRSRSSDAAGAGARRSCEQGSSLPTQLFQQPRPTVLGRRWAMLRWSSSSTPSSNDWLRRALQGCTGSSNLPPHPAPTIVSARASPGPIPTARERPLVFGQAWQLRGKAELAEAEPKAEHLKRWENTRMGKYMDVQIWVAGQRLRRVSQAPGETCLLPDSYFCRWRAYFNTFGFRERAHLLVL